ncbi:MAG TPA: protein kinase [Xanthomonadaceae bacterium]|nr:protein kinase [Xanthomonadaceae bacterium]
MIDIPGYRIVRPLGRGGMATVYLALQESVQREVALKIMSPTLLGDSEYGERFLREARIAAKLHHPHIVQVHDVSVHGEYHVIAMEYVAGGPVLLKGAPPRGLAYALRAVREVALALGYAHGKGVIHRDIKPDNILLREDGAAVLTDFGIARANDVTRMTRTGAIIGTPHYMSPEQARGHPLDGRADLYSLGIMFHELLLGRVPFVADDSVAVGIMHITAPLPRLPADLAALQPTLDRLLAKEPDQRFQTGEEVAAAIGSLEQRLADGELSAARRAVKRAVPVPAAPEATGTEERIEPSLGDIGVVSRTPRPRRRPVAASRRLGWSVAVVLLLAIGAGGWTFQERLRALWPQSQQGGLLAQADAALAARRLTSETGDGARELYAAALARDPDSDPAREGLRAVGLALLDSAREALEAGDPDAARQRLDLARELSPPASALQPVEAALRAHEQAGVQNERMLERARAAASARQLDGEHGAIALYGTLVQSEPGNARARAERDALLAGMIERAQEHTAAGELAQAQGLIERVAAADAGHIGLPGARGALADARQAREGELAAVLERADRALAAGRLEQARDGYRNLLERQPDRARARAGLGRVGEAYVEAASRAAADFDFDRAEALLASAAELVGRSPRLAEVERRIVRLRDRQATIGQAQGAGDLAARIEAAEAAAAAGRLTYPPGDSAYDLYRSVLRVDPENPRARAGLDGLPRHARARFDSALAAGELERARGYVDALESLSSSDASLSGMRQRLTRALLGIVSERLGAGEFARARRALDQAREMEPNHPEIPALQARLEQAQGG